ncbi:unnamed protein product [Symbiodinium sp. CCMP2592]|nr:unnamed protein product [Symbiodinium sp. CCMP2592]
MVVIPPPPQPGPHPDWGWRLGEVASWTDAQERRRAARDGQQAATEKQRPTSLPGSGKILASDFPAPEALDVPGRARVPLFRARCCVCGLLCVEALRLLAARTFPSPGGLELTAQILTSASNSIACVGSLPVFASQSLGVCVNRRCLGSLLTLILTSSMCTWGAVVIDIVPGGGWQRLSAHALLDEGAPSILGFLGVWECLLLASVSLQSALCISAWTFYRMFRELGLYPPGQRKGRIHAEVSALEFVCEAEDVALLSDQCNGNCQREPLPREEACPGPEVVFAMAVAAEASMPPEPPRGLGRDRLHEDDAILATQPPPGGSYEAARRSSTEILAQVQEDPCGWRSMERNENYYHHLVGARKLSCLVRLVRHGLALREREKRGLVLGDKKDRTTELAKEGVIIHKDLSFDGDHAVENGNAEASESSSAKKERMETAPVKSMPVLSAAAAKAQRQSPKSRKVFPWIALAAAVLLALLWWRTAAVKRSASSSMLAGEKLSSTTLRGENSEVVRRSKSGFAVEDLEKLSTTWGVKCVSVDVGIDSAEELALEKGVGAQLPVVRVYAPPATDHLAELVGPACTAAAVAQSLQSAKEKAEPSILDADEDIDCLGIQPLRFLVPGAVTVRQVYDKRVPYYSYETLWAVMSATMLFRPTGDNLHFPSLRSRSRTGHDIRIHWESMAFLPS